MTYYVSFKVNDSPYISQKRGGWKYYMLKCNGKAQSEVVKNKLQKMSNVSYIRVGTKQKRADRNERTVIDADIWFNNIKRK